MGRALTAEHKAAISAGLKRYWSSRKAGGGGGSSKPSVSTKIGAPRPIQHLETGKVISREDAARIMFGSGGGRKPAKKAGAGKRVGKNSAKRR